MGFPRRKPLSFCSPAALHAAPRARGQAGEEDASGSRGRDGDRDQDQDWDRDREAHQDMPQGKKTRGLQSSSQQHSEQVLVKRSKFQRVMAAAQEQTLPPTLRRDGRCRAGWGIRTPSQPRGRRRIRMLSPGVNWPSLPITGGAKGLIWGGGAGYGAPADPLCRVPVERRTQAERGGDRQSGGDTRRDNTRSNSPFIFVRSFLRPHSPGCREPGAPRAGTAELSGRRGGTTPTPTPGREGGGAAAGGRQVEPGPGPVSRSVSPGGR